MKKLEILATPFEDKSLCRFTLAVNLVEEGSFAIRKGVRSDSKLVNKIFEIEGVIEVTSESNYLIVRKDTELSWREVGANVGSALREADSEGYLFFPTESKNDSSGESLKVNKGFFETKLGKKITQAIELKISPSLGAHGGSVTPVDFKKGTLYLSFSGGCQGCSQASVTVRDGILRVLKNEFEEVEDVVDITDHGLGQSPYYK
jgi:Fe-S cluster biogenesis protein NfuA